MFENIGGKIKGMAKFFCWAGIILSVIIGIIYLTNSNRYQDLTTQGITILIAGPLCSWLGSLMTYGFGELIERAKSIDEKLNAPHAMLFQIWIFMILYKLLNLYVKTKIAIILLIMDYFL